MGRFRPNASQTRPSPAAKRPGLATASRTLRQGKVGMGSTSRVRPTHLARWEVAALTKTTARCEVAEGCRRGDVSLWRLQCGGRRRYPEGPAGQRRWGVRRGQSMEHGRGLGRCSLWSAEGVRGGDLAQIRRRPVRYGELRRRSGHKDAEAKWGYGGTSRSGGIG
jgi:hypothetical protein